MRSKKFQKLTGGLPEIGITLIDLWEWIIRNQFRDVTICPDPSENKIIIECKPVTERYEHFILYLYVFTKDRPRNTCLDFSGLLEKGFTEKLTDYFQYKTEAGSNDITFRKYDDQIEGYIKNFVIDLYDMEQKESIAIDY